MNIFYLDNDPIIAAQSLTNIHVNKMIIESAQMLANAYSKDELNYAPKSQKGNVRSYSYYNHPCSIWVRQSIYHFEWLLEHSLTMCFEKIYRGGKAHFSETFLRWCAKNRPSLPQSSFVCPPLAMPDFYKGDCAVESYRLYYNNDKRYDTRGKWIWNWSRRQRPDWAFSTFVPFCCTKRK